MHTDCIIHHWRIDAATGSLIHEKTGEQRRLGEFQFRLLQVLIEHAGQPLTREALTALVWERRVIGNNSLPNAIHALRVALEDDGKQQRIIRTLPRKGYILESGYCRFVPAATAAPDSPAGAHPADAPPPPPEPAPAEAIPSPLPRFSPRLWQRLVAVQCVLLLLIAGLLLTRQPGRTSVDFREAQPGVYSHIRLIELYRGLHVQSTAGDLSTQLGPVLYDLNQQLAQHRLTMDVYFYAWGASLNYTLSLRSRCDSRQLAMNVSNWRTDSAQLNLLIWRETQRKINEMAHCVS